MKNKILLLLGLSFLITSCGNSTHPFEKNPEDEPGTGTITPPPKDDPITDPDISQDPPKERTIFDDIKDLKEAKINYTIDVIDYGGDFRQVFYPNSYSLRFDEENYTQHFVEDKNGIFDLVTYVGDQAPKAGFYYVNENNEYLKSLYADLFFTFKDLTLNATDYELKEDKLFIKDHYCDDAIVLFNLCGYSTNNKIAGMQLTDVKEMYFFKNEIGQLNFNMTWNSLTSDRGTTSFSVCNIGVSIQDKQVFEYLESGRTGIFRLGSNDKMYTRLANLKNLRNYTLKVKGEYKNPSANYTYEAKYMSYAFYGASSFEGQEDIGYITKDKKTYYLLYDGVNDEVVQGDNIPEYDNKDLYLDLLFSFATTKWNPFDFKATFIENEYLIYEQSYLIDLAKMLNNSFMVFQLISTSIDYDEKTNEYHFVYNLYGGDKIYIDVVDINKTTIYNLTEK